MPTQLQLAKKVLAEKILQAVKEFQLQTDMIVLTVDVPLLKDENTPKEDAVTTEYSVTQPPLGLATT
jgi:hypothetical protein